MKCQIKIHLIDADNSAGNIFCWLILSNYDDNLRARSSKFNVCDMKPNLNSASSRIRARDLVL